MTSKIFRSIFFTSVVVLLCSIVLISGLLFDIFNNQLLNELKTEAEYIKYIYETYGENFSSFSDINRRVTIINSTGTVISDTHKNPLEMENHLDRAEVILALQQGEGHSSRYSDTLMQKNIYYAKRLSDGNVLRVSTQQYTAFTIMVSLVSPLATVLAIASAVCFFLASKISKELLKPINQIDIDNPEIVNTYDEISPLLSKITAQKKTIAKQLSDAFQKQREFMLITENMSEGFLIIDSKANLLSHNSSALKLLNVTNEGVSGKNVLLLNHSSIFRSTIDDALSGKRVQNEMTYEASVYSLIANPAYDKDRVIGAVIIIIDITEASERAALRREFTANVSHELKTPLTSISGFAELMKDGAVTGEDVVDFSKSIFDESQRLINLVCDIIKISELDEKTGNYKFESIDLLELCKNIANRFENPAKINGITLITKGESVKITGVRRIIEEMISNLCDNAIKYNKQHGSVAIELQSSQDTVSVSVTDTGCGIPQNEQQRIFERFYRVDKGRSKAVGGTGLGLSIVKHAAMFHDAQVFLESQVGVGTKITVQFKK